MQSNESLVHWFLESLGYEVETLTETEVKALNPLGQARRFHLSESNQSIRLQLALSDWMESELLDIFEVIRVELSETLPSGVNLELFDAFARLTTEQHEQLSPRFRGQLKALSIQAHHQQLKYFKKEKGHDVSSYNQAPLPQELAAHILQHVRRQLTGIGYEITGQSETGLEIVDLLGRSRHLKLETRASSPYFEVRVSGQTWDESVLAKVSTDDVMNIYGESKLLQLNDVITDDHGAIVASWQLVDRYHDAQTLLTATRPTSQTQ